MQAVRNTDVAWNDVEAKPGVGGWLERARSMDLGLFAPGLTEAGTPRAPVLRAPRLVLALALVGAAWGACALAWTGGAGTDAHWQDVAVRTCAVDCAWQELTAAR